MNLRIGNSYCTVEGLTGDLEKKLKNALSYSLDPSASYYSGSFKTKRSLLGKRGDFPSGLLYLVKEFLYKNKLEVNIRDTRVQPPRDKFYSLNLPFPPYQEQIDIAQLVNTKARGTISACTGFGKSVAMAMLIGTLKVKTLVVVPNLGLKAQLQATFDSLFKDTSNIRIENIDSPALNTAIDYDCLIIDEAHHSAAATYRRLNKKQWAGIYYRYFFTATPFRTDDNERLLLESIVGRKIYEISYKTAVKKGYVVPVEAYYYTLPKVEVEGYTWQEVYKELIVDRKDRNGLISVFLQSLQVAKVSTLCLVKEIKHGNNLVKTTGAAFASGTDTKDCKQLICWFNDKKLTCLVGTTGVIGEGVDTKPAEYVIIACLGKSKPAFMQQVGRGVRPYPGKESCKIIIFKDPSHKFTLRHFNAQVRILKEEYGCIPVEGI